MADEIVNQDTYDLLAPDPTEEVVEEQEEKEEEPKEEEKEEKPKKGEIEIEGADEEVLEEEEPEEPEEDIDLITPVRTKEILAKYPTLFKDFPYLKAAYFRDKQYTSILPTVSDAKEAVEKSQTLDKFEGDLKKGSTESILKAIKENDATAFGRIVDDYLPSLQRVDPNAFYHIVANIARPLILNMAQRGQATNNDDLKQAALTLNRFLFESDTLTPMQKYAKEPDPNAAKAQTELQREREAFFREKIESVQSDLELKAGNALKTTIDLHIDPKGVMSDYVKRNAIRDCLSHVEQMIGSDRQFRVHLDNLWKRAADENFSRTSQERIRAAYLGKAKTYLPIALQKARNEALKGVSRTNNTNAEPKNKRGPITPGKATTSSNSGKNEMKPGEKTLDFLMRD